MIQTHSKHGQLSDCIRGFNRTVELTNCLIAFVAAIAQLTLPTQLYKQTIIQKDKNNVINCLIAFAVAIAQLTLPDTNKPWMWSIVLLHSWLQSHSWVHQLSDCIRGCNRAVDQICILGVQLENIGKKWLFVVIYVICSSTFFYLLVTWRFVTLCGRYMFQCFRIRILCHLLTLRRFVIFCGRYVFQ